MHRPNALREHALVALAFVASRLALAALGVPFGFSLDWMWLSDPADLQHRLLQTIYYFHAFPPGMSLLTGVLLKAGGEHAATLAYVSFLGLGLLLVQSLFYLARASGLSVRVSVAAVMAFSLLPQSIYFEHLYLYEEPVAALLCLSVALFHAAIRRRSTRLWVAFFAVCASIGITRSTFHLIWFAAMAAAAISFTPSRPRRILIAAAAPAAVLLALYVKNFVVFGTFGALTYGPSAYAHVTVAHLPADIRVQWIREQKLSPFAALSPYAGPAEHLAIYAGGSRTEWPSQLTRLGRPTVHAPNFNHWLILEANRRRTADAWQYLRTRPLEYAGNALRGLRDFFAPSTEWHPHTGTPRSPHAGHRRALGGYEAAINSLVHAFPLAPVGLYAFLPLAMAWTAWRAWRLTTSGDAGERARGAMLWLCAFNIVYVTAISSAFTFLESSRYRFQIEPLIWLTSALAAAALSQFATRRLLG